MARRRPTKPERRKAPPIAIEPVDLLAGLGPGMSLAADDLPAGVAGAEKPTPTEVGVNDVGRLIRSGEPTVVRLIRTAMLRPKPGRREQ
jgi:hypothetical protein